MRGAHENANAGERLRLAREAVGMTQTSLGKRAGLQPAAIGHFEKGRRLPSFANLRALAQALNVSADYLLGLTDGPARPTPPSAQEPTP